MNLNKQAVTFPSQHTVNTHRTLVPTQRSKYAGTRRHTVPERIFVPEFYTGIYRYMEPG
jgi:hypothetical protein